MGIRSYTLFIVLFVFVMMLIGCGTEKDTRYPKFMYNIPEDTDYLYGTGAGQSDDRQKAIDMALDNARSGIVNQFDARIKQLFGEAIDQPSILSEEVLSKVSKVVSGGCKVMHEEVKHIRKII